MCNNFTGLALFEPLFNQENLPNGIWSRSCVNLLQMMLGFDTFKVWSGFLMLHLVGLGHSWILCATYPYPTLFLLWFPLKTKSKILGGTLYEIKIFSIFGQCNLTVNVAVGSYVWLSSHVKLFFLVCGVINAIRKLFH